MTRKLDLPHTRHHIEIFDEDWEFLLRLYGPASESRYGVGPAIRHMVHARVRDMIERVGRLQNGLAGTPADAEEQIDVE